MRLLRCVVLWAALLLPLALQAEGEAPTPAGRFDAGLLWKITTPGKPPSFVFGTLHLNADSVLTLPPAVEQAFDGAGTFAAEVIFDGSERRTLQLAMISSAAQLPALLGADWPQVEAQLALRRFPEALRPHLRPWAALVLLMQPQQSGDKDVLDVMLTRRARRAGKTVVSLETVAEQTEALSTLPEETQLGLLRHAVSVSGRLDTDIDAITRFYLAGDLAGAWALQLKHRGESPALRAQQDALAEALIMRRNQVFARRALPLVMKGGAFVSVGALHLHGPQGLPALLEARGLKVERAD